jgi:iron complex outermembrane receptor protein
VVNVGDSRINGAEFEARLAPGGGWNFNLGLGWLDTKVTRDAVAARTGGAASIEVGRNLANAPKFTANVGITKEFDLGGDTQLKANVNGSYASSVELRLTDTAATRVFGTNPPDLLLNAFLALNFGPEGKYRVSVWGKNLTDELTIHYTQEFGVGSIMGIPGDPRRFGVTFGVDF